MINQPVQIYTNPWADLVLRPSSKLSFKIAKQINKEF